MNSNVTGTSNTTSSTPCSGSGGTCTVTSAAAVAVRIAAAREIDADELLRFGATEFARTFGHLYTAEDLTAYLAANYSRQAYEKWATDPQYKMLIAFDSEDSSIDGYILCGPNTLPLESISLGDGTVTDDPSLPSAEIKRMYVHPRVFGTAVAEALLLQAIAWLRYEQNYRHIYLGVYSENYRAQRFYQKHGFARVGAYSFKVGDHSDPEYIMKLLIN